jgi:uncharacterized protein YlxP (DUF503 family)
MSFTKAALNLNIAASEVEESDLYQALMIFFGIAKINCNNH